MRDYQSGPIIIKLGGCANEKADIAKIVKKRLESLKTGVKKRKPLEHDIRKNSNVYMMTECDDVLKNDFQWLINFNLKKIPIRDIDEELPRNKLLNEQKSGRRKNSVIKHTHRLSLSGKLYLLLIKTAQFFFIFYKYISKNALVITVYYDFPELLICHLYNFKDKKRSDNTYSILNEIFGLSCKD